MQRVAVLGLGLMGAAIALRLKAQGFAVTGWNRGPEKAAALAAEGLSTVPTAAEALALAELAVLVLSDAEAIAGTLLDPASPLDLRGKTLLQMGTIAPDQSRDLAKRIAAAGGDYLEAPVLGSLPEARDGRLIVMAGGEPELFARCLPLLRALGQDPRLIGPLGKGAAVKLAMNQLIAGLTATFSLSLGLVRAEGIDPQEFMGLLRSSALYAPTFDKKLDKYLSRSYGQANFPLKHLLKDVRLFRQVAERLGMDTAVVTTIEAACMRGVGQGYGDQDYSALYEALTSLRGGS
jgi:3-hydroxyisobutyrate dehydrogenase